MPVTFWSNHRKVNTGLRRAALIGATDAFEIHIVIETPQIKPRFLDVGGCRIAVQHRAGRDPGVFWLGGYRSDMGGTKALALDRFAAERGLEMTRFDYSGHGASGGAFEAGTISRWLDEAQAVFDAVTSGEQIVVGSSMGGWLALLMNRALRERGTERVKALVLVAPAVDMTEALMVPEMTAAERKALAADGRIERPSEYAEEPDVITRALIEDGERHLMFGAPIATGCPIAILQGAQDTDVPPEHAMRLMSHLLSDEASLNLVPDGDHRLSTEADLERLVETVSRFV